VATAFDPGTLDPHAIALLYHSRVVSQVYDSQVGRNEAFETEPALAPTSQRAFQLKGVTGAKAVDPLTVDLLLEAPDAVLPDKLQYIAMMSAPAPSSMVCRPRRTSTPSRKPMPRAEPGR